MAWEVDSRFLWVEEPDEYGEGDPRACYLRTLCGFCGEQLGDIQPVIRYGKAGQWGGPMKMTHRVTNVATRLHPACALKADEPAVPSPFVDG